MSSITTSHPRGRQRPPATEPAALSKGVAPITPSTPPTGNFIEPERRQAMISEAAYFLAERRGFCPGGELEDWVAAEAEIDRALSSGQSENRYGG